MDQVQNILIKLHILLKLLPKGLKRMNKNISSRKITEEKTTVGSYEFYEGKENIDKAKEVSQKAN